MGIHNKSISRRIFIKFISLEAISLYLMRCNKRDHANSTVRKELNELLVETPYIELGYPGGDGFYIIPNNALRKISESRYFVFRRIVIENEVFIIPAAVNIKLENNNLMAEPFQSSEKYQIKKGDQLFISNNNFSEIFSKQYTKAHRIKNRWFNKNYHSERTP